jgi:hypothetical protein
VLQAFNFAPQRALFALAQGTLRGAVAARFALQAGGHKGVAWLQGLDAEFHELLLRGGLWNWGEKRERKNWTETLRKG